MDFSEALKWLKDGGKATRNSWPSGMYVTLTSEMGLSVVQIEPDGRWVRAWMAPSEDLLSDDWLIASADGTIQWPDGTVA